MMIREQRSIWIAAISVVALGFGLLTIREGGTILFGDEGARVAAGNFVPFVLWFNFIAGFAYVIAGVGLWMQRRWAAWLAVVIISATVLTFVAFGVHVLIGGDYEQRTVIAMSLRTLVWAVISAIAWQKLLQRNPRGASELWRESRSDEHPLLAARAVRRPGQYRGLDQARGARDSAQLGATRSVERPH
jgi:hypothetical protein